MVSALQCFLMLGTLRKSSVNNFCFLFIHDSYISPSFFDRKLKVTYKLNNRCKMSERNAGMVSQPLQDAGLRLSNLGLFLCSYLYE